ncbi:hypothetical protein ACFLS4_04415 [Bacteroidota bacterium]
MEKTIYPKTNYKFLFIGIIIFIFGFLFLFGGKIILGIITCIVGLGTFGASFGKIMSPVITLTDDYFLVGEKKYEYNTLTSATEKTIKYRMIGKIKELVIYIKGIEEAIKITDLYFIKKDFASIIEQFEKNIKVEREGFRSKSLTDVDVFNT